LKTLATIGGASLAGPWLGHAASSPEKDCQGVAGKTVKWIVPSSPGGGYDAYSRLIEPFFEKRIGAEVVVQNIPGGGGLVGAQTIKSAEADGRTLGILNGPGLLAASITGERQAPHPAKHFTILGRVESHQHTWATSASSPFRTLGDLLAAKRPILAAVSGMGGTAFLNVCIASYLLGLEVEYISGYGGSRARMLAVMRGEVDFSSFGFESMLDHVEAGNLRPILQSSVEPVASHPALAGVPLLGGMQGRAAQRAATLGREVEEAIADARGLAAIFDAGRLVAAPRGLDEEIARCFEKALHATLTDAAFIAAAAKARRSLHHAARAAETLAGLCTATASAQRFAPIIQDAIARVRR